MKIRKYNTKDLPDIVRINTDCWKTNYKWYIDQNYLDNISYEDRLKKTSENPKIERIWIALIAEDKWKVKWFIHWWESRDEDIDIKNEIYAIYVDTNCQWQWIWQKLFKELLKVTWRKEFYLRTLKDNIQSRWFYEKMWWIKFDEKDSEIAKGKYKLVAYKRNI